MKCGTNSFSEQIAFSYCLKRCIEIPSTTKIGLLNEFDGDILQILPNNVRSAFNTIKFYKKFRMEGGDIVASDKSEEQNRINRFVQLKNGAYCNILIFARIEVGDIAFIRRCSVVKLHDQFAEINQQTDIEVILATELSHKMIYTRLGSKEFLVNKYVQ